jgi:membrane protease YdiL (CAAX protease family)
MSTLVLDSAREAHPRPLASVRHTAVLVAVFLATAVWGAAMQGHAAPAGAFARPSSVVPLYLSLLAMEWGLVLYVWRTALRPRGVPLRDLVGGRWSARSLALDVAIGLATWGLWTAMTPVVTRLWPSHAATVETLLPRTPLEIALWLALSMSAGFSEELVFRGYFQTQLLAWTRRPWIAVLGQAILFGVSHGYQGVRSCVTITAYGAMMGVLAIARKSLRPGMVAHAWTDVASGIFRW